MPRIIIDIEEAKSNFGNNKGGMFVILIEKENFPECNSEEEFNKLKHYEQISIVLFGTIQENINSLVELSTKDNPIKTTVSVDENALKTARAMGLRPYPDLDNKGGD